MQFVAQRLARHAQFWFLSGRRHQFQFSFKNRFQDVLARMVVTNDMKSRHTRGFESLSRLMSSSCIAQRAASRRQARLSADRRQGASLVYVLHLLDISSVKSEVIRRQIPSFVAPGKDDLRHALSGDNHGE